MGFFYKFAWIPLIAPRILRTLVSSGNMIRKFILHPEFPADLQQPFALKYYEITSDFFTASVGAEQINNLSVPNKYRLNSEEYTQHAITERGQ